MSVIQTVYNLRLLDFARRIQIKACM